MSRLWLAPSDSSLADAINLSDQAGASAGNGTMTIHAGLHLPPPAPRTGSSNDLDDGSGYGPRTVTLDLFLKGGEAVQLHAYRRDILALLERAMRATGAAGGHWIGSPVCLWVEELDSPNYVQFDVLRSVMVEKVRDFGPERVQQWTLTLTCLPFARGTPLPVEWTGTLKNGYTSGVPTVITRLGVPGDVPALCQVLITDHSTGGVVLNGIRLGRRSLEGGVTFSPLLPVVAYSPGTSYADASALDGAHTPRLACTGEWRTLGVATCTDSAGLVALRPHLRDSTSLLVPPQNLTAGIDLTAGALAAGTYAVAVSWIDALGGESGAIALTGIVLPSTGQLQLVWTEPGVPSNHRVYVKLNVGAWGYFLTGSTTTSYTLSTISGAIAGTPSLIGTPTALVATPDTSSGALQPGTYSIVVTELDVAGRESLATDPVSATFAGALGEIALDWVVTGSPHDHRVYFLPDGATVWAYFATTLATSGYTLTTVTGATLGAPPLSTTAQLAGAEVRLSVALNVTSPVFGKPCTPIVTKLRAGRWEYGDPRVFTVPPVQQPEGGYSLGYKVLVEARGSGTQPPTLDCDGIWQYPLDEPSTVAEVEGLALASAATLVIDTRRDGRVAGLLTDGGTPPTVTGTLDVRGPFTLGVGDNIITVAGVAAGGVADVTNLKYAVGLRIVPRYLDVIGLVT